MGSIYGKWELRLSIGFKSIKGLGSTYKYVPPVEIIKLATSGQYHPSNQLAGSTPYCAHYVDGFKTGDIWQVERKPSTEFKFIHPMVGGGVEAKVHCLKEG